MASLIPKIKVGKASGKREKHNLSFDCSTTSNIGTIQPTMCREMVPNSKLKVKVSSLVRLASMPLPSFGRMSLRHYHCFVPYVDLWQPFDAMMSGQHYQGVDTASFIPTNVPFFKMPDLFKYIINYSDISICFADDLENPLTITESNVAWDGTVFEVGEDEGQYATMDLAIEAAQAHDLAVVQTAWSSIRNGLSIFNGQTYDGIYTDGAGSLSGDDYGVLNLGGFYATVAKSDTTLVFGDGSVRGNVRLYPSGNTPISYEGADIITFCNAGRGYTLLFKFKAPLKRLRQIFIGLGYQFNPYNRDDEFSILKLLAYYKAWFSLFRPNREVTFVDTSCYKLIKKLSEKNGVNAKSGIGGATLWYGFIEELLQTYYYLPMDYYSMAVKRPADSNQDNDFIVNSGSMDFLYQGSSSPVQGADNSNDNVTVRHGTSGANQFSMVSMQGSGNLSPLTIKLAMRMLTWANKNTVIGRSIREYLKVHFGITDTSTIDDDAVYRIGSSRTNITISDVMSTAESQEGYLGEYGGKGIGYGDSEKFDFTADKFGVWLTLTTVVPESGYCQGYLKENKHLNRYQFFNPEYDALGYQVLERGEIMSAFHCDSFSAGNPINPRLYEYSKAFGFVPRYSEYKVGHNIVNGDLSLPGLFNSMGAYTLDRMIPDVKFARWQARSYAAGKPYEMRPESPDFLPTIVFDNFRRIDPTDHLGQYNRIFNYVSNDLDHFIIHNVFDVDGYLPMKSLSDSFDTVSKEDDGSIDITHA